MRRVQAKIAKAIGVVCLAGGLWACSPDMAVGVPEHPDTARDPSAPAVPLLPVVPDETQRPGPRGVAGALLDPRPTPWAPKDCPELFADDQLLTFEVELAEADWKAIQSEFRNVESLEDEEVEVYRPLTSFTFKGRAVTGAMMRLRGNPTYWPSQDKMQFQISFNETNPDGRFMGLRKIVLDSAHYNRSYLRDRLAMSMARDAGLPAPCANHARLVVNGELYGLYTHLEKVDREFLERNFEDPSANLYKRGQILKTNEDEQPDTSRIDAFWAAKDVEALETVAQVQQLARAWAMEAIFPDADGYWSGGWNFYLYDEPGKGFAYILWDVDLAFNNLPADTDPLTWHKTNSNFNGRPHVEALLDDPKWRDEFVREVRAIRETIDAGELQARIDRWSAQISAAAKEDRHAPWTFEEHQRSVEVLRAYVAERVAYLDGWLARHDPGHGGSDEPGDD